MNVIKLPIAPRNSNVTAHPAIRSAAEERIRMALEALRQGAAASAELWLLEAASLSGRLDGLAMELD